ncbi:GNAT family N-acetyltransferase [Lewinella sp. IMCC34183]|uniref:GNAT family N-acetyltransferase n=1 Tax=Lewinella sp. IMCC34183 TaxID=2248762 RepID=UPI000E25AE22|nr:GNAT family N-acetyltransferase [Lewinella sp. IMCC34183]
MDSSTLSFVPVRPDQQPTLYALMRRIYPPVYAYLWPDGGAWYVDAQYSPENVHRELAEPDADYRFIQLNDEPVGIVRSVAGRPAPDRLTLNATKLHRLYLDPAVAGRGIGSRALEFVEAQCRKRGDKLLWLEAMDSAADALAFYERLGFARLAPFTLEMPRMLPAYRGMWRMGKEL